MEENLKQLLLKDLCARLPFGVICRYDTVVPLLGEVLNNGELQEIKNRGKYFIVNGATCLYDDIKPYLRPMSSMTEEEKEELKDIIWFGYPSDDYDDYGHRGIGIVDLKYDDWKEFGFDFEDYCKLEDWLNSHHFDFRNLIERGLAIDCTNLNIY